MDCFCTVTLFDSASGSGSASGCFDSGLLSELAASCGLASATSGSGFGSAFDSVLGSSAGCSGSTLGSDVVVGSGVATLLPPCGAGASIGSPLDKSLFNSISIFATCVSICTGGPISIEGASILTTSIGGGVNSTGAI